MYFDGESNKGTVLFEELKFLWGNRFFCCDFLNSSPIKIPFKKTVEKASTPYLHHGNHSNILEGVDLASKSST
jgi:hypothetical protein